MCGGSSASLGETHSVQPVHLNEFRLEYVRTDSSTTPQGLGTNYTVQSGIGGFVGTERGISQVSPASDITGYLGFNANAFSPIKFRDNKYEARTTA